MGGVFVHKKSLYSSSEVEKSKRSNSSRLHSNNNEWVRRTQKQTIRDKFSNLFYQLHLKTRHPHDIAWKNVRWYRKISSNDSYGIKRGAISAMVFVTVVAVVLSNLLPQANNRNQALAASSSKTWTTNGDFAYNKAGWTGSGNAALCAGTTQNANVAISGAAYTDGTCAAAAADAGVGLKSARIPTLAADNFNSYFIKPDGSVWGTGFNSYGALGAGVTYQITSFTQSNLTSGVKTVAAGGDSNGYALKTDGSVWAAGNNNVGALGIGSTDSSNHSSFIQTGITSGAMAISAAYDYVLVLKTDGSVWGAGANNYGQLGIGSTATPQATFIQSNLTSGVVAIATGRDSAFAVKSDGSVWATGFNSYGQLGNGNQNNQTSFIQSSITSGAIAVAAGYYNSTVLKADGSVWNAGDNNYGALGIGTVDGNAHTFTQSNITSGAVAVTGGFRDTFAIKNDGSLWATGFNSGSEFGLNNTTQQNSFVNTGLTNVVAVDASEASWPSFVIALKADGSIWAAGYNNHGQLGTGDTNQSLTFINPVSGGKQPFTYPTQSATISGLKIDAGTGAKAKWANMSWTATTPTNTSVKFNVRTSDDNSTWSSWSSDLTTAGGSTITASTSRYLEIQMTLTSTDGISTPTLNDFTVNYNNLDAPATLKAYKSDNTDISTTSNYTNETSATLKADLGVPFTGGTPITPQFEVRTADSGWTASPATPAGVTATAQNVTYVCAADPCSALGSQTVGTVFGMVPGTTYYWRARSTDAAGRVGPWSASSTVINIDQTAPQVTAVAGPQYATSTTTSITVTASDAGGSHLNKLYLSNDGSAWTDATPGSGFTGQDSYNSSVSWTLASGDGAKTVYAKVTDTAGSTSGKTFTSQADWEVGTRSNADTTSTSGDLKISKQYSQIANIASGGDKSVAINENTNTYYVSANISANANITVINGATNSTVTTISPSGATSGSDLGVNPTTNKLYAAPYSGNIYVINTTNNTITKTITNANNFHGIAVNPITNKIYALNGQTGNIVVVDGSTDTVSTTITGTGYLGGAAIMDKANNRLYFGTGSTIKYINCADNSINSTTMSSYYGVFDIDVSRDRLYSFYYNGSTFQNRTAVYKLSDRSVITDFGSNQRLSIAANTNTGLFATSGYGTPTIYDYNGNVVSTFSVTGLHLFNNTTGKLLTATSSNTYVHDIVFASPATLGETGTALQYDSGVGNSQKLAALSWKADPLLTGQTIKFMVSTDGSNWKGPNGNAGDWTNNYFGQIYGGSANTAIPSSLASSRYLYVKVKMESSGNDTPILHDLSIQSAGVTTSSITLDTTAPTSTSFQIKDSSTSSTSYVGSASNKLVTLVMNPNETGSGMASFQLSNDGSTWGTTTDVSGNVTNSGTWGTWNAAYTSTGYTGNWYLNGADGSKTVYVKYKDNAGNIGGIGTPGANWIAGRNGSSLYGYYAYNRDLAASDKYTNNNTIGSASIQWKNATTACSSPQCSTTAPVAETQSGYTGKNVLVADNGVNFNPSASATPDYPARDACKALGGRLPTIAEIEEMYSNQATYGNNFTTATYYQTATEVDSTYNYVIGMNNGSIQTGSKTGTRFVRCVAMPAATISTSITLDTVAPTASTAPTLNANPNNTGNQTVSWSTFSDTAPSSNFKSYTLQRKMLTPTLGTYVNATPDVTSQGTLSYADNSNLSAGTYVYHVIYTDNAGNTATTADSATLTVDTTSPTISSVSINSGATYVNSNAVTLSISATDPGTPASGVTLMQFSNDNGATWGKTTDATGAITDTGWATYATTYSWNLTRGTSGGGSDGTRTVLARVKDVAGNITSWAQTSNTDFGNGLTKTNLSFANGDISLLGSWITGLSGTALEGKYVKAVDSGSSLQWKTSDTACSSPQCNTGLDSNYPAKNSLVSSNAVDFSLYPARNLCKADGGRLPYAPEILALYGAQASYGNNFSTNYYRTGTETNTSAPYDISFTNGIVGNYFNKTTTGSFLNVRCVSDTNPGITYLSPGTFESSIWTAASTSNITYGKPTFTTNIPGGTSLTVYGRAGNTATPDGTWTDYQTLSSGTIAPSILSGNKYFQYKVVMTGGSATPTFSDFAIETSTPSQQVTLDTQAPTGTLSIKDATTNNTSYAKSTSVLITPNGSDLGGSNLYQMQFSNDGSNWSAWEVYSASPKAWTIAAGSDGPRTVYVKYKDNAGNIAGDLMVASGNWGVTTSTNIHVYNVESVGKLNYANAQSYCSAIGSGARLPTIDEFQYFGVSQDEYYWSSSDAAGGNKYAFYGYDGSTAGIGVSSMAYAKCVRTVVDNSIKNNILLDTTAPTTTGAITGGTTGTNGWYKSNVTYTLTPADAISNVNFTQYCTDTTGTCTPGTGYTTPITLLTESTTNHIRWASTDNAGNTQAVQDSGIIKVDTSAPAASISFASSMQADPTINLNTTLADTISGIQSVKIEYKAVDMTNGTPGDFSTASWTDSGLNIPNTSGTIAFSAQTGKAYKFHIQATNNAGLTGAGTTEPGSLNAFYEPNSGNDFVVVDTTAPMATISYNSNTNGFQNNTTINLTITKADSQSGLSDADLEYKEVAVTNGVVGNFSAATWQDNPNGDGGDLNVTTFAGRTGYAYLFRYRVKNNAGLWASGSSEPGTLNAYAAPANWIGVDTDAPTASVSINGANLVGSTYYVNHQDIHLSLSATDPGGSNLTSYEIFDGTGWEAPVNISGYTFSDNNVVPTTPLPSGEGVKSVQVRFTDTIGNAFTFDFSGYTISYDSINPDGVVLTGPANNYWQQSNTQTFAWLQSVSSDVDHYELYIDDSNIPVNANISANSFSVQATLSNQGLHTWFLRTVDHALNYADSATRSIGWDQLNPSKILDPSFTFSATSNVTGKITLNWNTYADVSGTGSAADVYTIERIKYAFADTNNLLTQNWDSLDPAADYFTTDLDSTNHTYEQLARDPLVQADLANSNKVDDSVKYIYRIKVTDLATNVSNWLVSGAGMSYDQKAPTNPNTVLATACDGTTGTCATVDSLGNPNTKGFAVKIGWTHSTDSGVGVVGYKIYRKAESDSPSKNDFTLVGYYKLLTLGAATDPVYYDNDTANIAVYSDTIGGVSIPIKSTASPKINDYTSYFYRITALDANGNESPVISQSSDLVPLNTTENEASASTPDVTSPLAATNFNANAIGLDNQSDTDPKQEVDLSWTAAVDAKAPNRVPAGTGRGIQKYVLSFATENSSALNAHPENLNFTVLDNNIVQDVNTYPHARLEDNTYYYYKLEAYDFDNTPTSTSIYSALTGSSKLPSTATYVSIASVKGNANQTGSRVGKDINISFIGAKYLDPGNEVTGYEVYRSATNYAANSDWLDPTKASLVKTYSNLNITNNSIDPGENSCSTVRINVNGTETDIHKRCFTDSVPVDATTYFYRIRTVGFSQTRNSVVYSPGLSGIVLSNIGSGWDTVPDATAPELPAGLKVKDIHDDGMNYKRNIVTWGRIATPLRNGVNDFKEYKIYRSNDGLTWQQICQSGVNSILLPSCTVQNPNPLYNPNKDVALATNYYMDLIPVSQANQYYYYYATAVDDAETAYNYITPNDTTIVNAYSNESHPPKNIDGTIVSVSLNPAIAVPSILAESSGLKADLVTVGVSTATIHWTTDQACDAMVRFRKAGTSDNYREIGEGASTLGIGMITEHTVNLFGLAPNSTYEYQIISSNSLGNPSIAQTSELPVLTTSGFNVTFGTSSTTTSTAEITWTTNLDASSAFIEYQLQKQPGDDAQGGTAGVEPTDLSANPRSHRVVVKGLRSNRTYTYKVKSISTDGFVAETDFLNFKTRNFDSEQFTIAPSSSNVAERNITSTTAQIVWTTSVPATSWIDYATTPGVKDQSKENIKSIGNNDLTTQHIVVLDGLIPGTKYYYRCRVKDSNEIEFTSQEYSFTAVLKPKISNLSISDVKPYSVTISWETNVDTETIMNWGKTKAYGEKRGKNELTKNHRVMIDGLDDNNEYHFQILAHDDAGNEVADDDKVVRTPLDTEGPKIENVKTDILPMGASDTAASVVISWNTNKPASTLVEYDEGIIGGHYSKSSIEDKTLNLSHTVIVKELKPASSYHYHIVTADKRGNTTKSNDFTFITPSQEKSILQLILKSLEETFSWTQHINSFFGNVGKRMTGK